ncbi:unnamed protein product [Angiostrongylus costaricensis]|uniref:C-type lectin domain-containing protein n=1 Tax=Angiostrongylus costaricensis TaxID=334426 RepID=A0A158PF99_ANGCS|nr:unnamed protein product [Angiostrongylus costaricensis]
MTADHQPSCREGPHLVKVLHSNGTTFLSIRLSAITNAHIATPASCESSARISAVLKKAKAPIAEGKSHNIVILLVAALYAFAFGYPLREGCGCECCCPQEDPTTTTTTTMAPDEPPCCVCCPPPLQAEPPTTTTESPCRDEGQVSTTPKPVPLNGPKLLKCPPGFKRIDMSCYYVEKEQMVFHQAAMNCVNMGAQLFVPQDISEWNGVMALAPPNFWTWTGLVKKRESQDPEWNGMVQSMDASLVYVLSDKFDNRMILSGPPHPKFHSCSAFRPWLVKPYSPLANVEKKMCCQCCQFFCAFIAPPLAVMCHSGCTRSFFINVVLTLLGFLPGVVHAIFVICSEKEKSFKVTTNVNVVSPQVIPMYQPVQPPPAPAYYPAAPPPPPVYYSDAVQKF